MYVFTQSKGMIKVVTIPATRAEAGNKYLVGISVSLGKSKCVLIYDLTNKSACRKVTQLVAYLANSGVKPLNNSRVLLVLI
jgi:hypothetical protein